MARCSAALLIAALGCAAPSRRPCELEAPEVIARSTGLSFDGVALAGGGTQRAYAWSGREGLFVQRGSAVPMRLGARCAGGLAALATNTALLIACSRPHEDGGEVVLYRDPTPTRFHGSPDVPTTTDAPTTTGAPTAPTTTDVPATAAGFAMTRVGRAGRDGQGIALAALEHDVYVAYHEGSIGDHAIWLARLDARRNDDRRHDDGASDDRAGAAGTAQLQRLSRPGAAAREPALTTQGGHVYATFAELTLRDDGAPASELFLSRDGAVAQHLLRARTYSPTPKLTADARGLVLGYRDRAREGLRSELRVVRLDAAGRISGAAVVVGRANDAGEPNLYGCGDLLAALLPREYGGERYVGIHPLDDALSALGAGHQLYESGHDFVLATGACDARGWSLFAAERAAPSKPGVQAIAMGFRCAD